MNERIYGIIAGVVLLISGACMASYLAGRSNGLKLAADQVEAAHFYFDQRTAADEHNGDVLQRYINGEISDEDASLLMVDTERKTEFIPFTGEPPGGTITFGKYDPAGDPHATRRSPWGLKSCTIWMGENEYDCGEESGATVKCVIYVIREKGPMAGTTFYAKKCDGLPISRRSTGKGVRDGYIISYDFSKFIPKQP